jgi:Sushi repeat (SCR repeat)
LSTNATYYGAAALYECFPKFKLDGVSRRLCSEDGTWGHETPMCVEITCPVPDVNEHLIVEAAKRLVGETAKFSCTKGRNLIGNSTRHCTAEGKWAGKNPVCKREFEKLLMKIFSKLIRNFRQQQLTASDQMT